MPAPYKTATQILADAIETSADPLEQVHGLARAYAWSLDTHAVAVLAVAREARRDVHRRASAVQDDHTRRGYYRCAEQMSRPAVVTYLEHVRHALDTDDRPALAAILGRPGDAVAEPLADAVQVDHLDDDQAAEVLAILERAGY